MTAISVVTYCLASLAARLLRGGDLAADETEQAIMSQFLWMGYGDQPPLYNWLAHYVNLVLGPSLLALALLKAVMIFLCCLFIGLAAKRATGSREAGGIAAIGCLTLPAIVLLSQRDLSHSVGAFAAVGLFLYAMVQVISRPSWFHYGLLGLAAGLGFLSKYNFVIVPAAAVIAVLMDPVLRRMLFDRRLIATIAVGLVISLPHALWIFDNLGIATGDTIAKLQRNDSAVVPDQVDAVLELILAIFKCSALTLTVFCLAYRPHLKRIAAASNQWTTLAGRMLIISMLLILCVLFGVDATEVRPKWISIFFLLLPLYLALKLATAGLVSPPTTRYYVAVCIAVAFLCLGTVTLGGLAERWWGVEDHQPLPYAAVAEEIRAAVNGEPTSVIVADPILGGNLKMQLPSALIMVTRLTDRQANRTAPQVALWLSEAGDAIPDWVSNYESGAARASDVRRAQEYRYLVLSPKAN